MTVRFWSRVEKTDGCWNWTGDRSDDGYGRICIRGRRVCFAHRVSWEMHNGSIPEGMCVLHRCDNPRCVRPDHLFVGTREDNAKDRDAKWRGVFARGEANGQAKLTEIQVREIRGRFGFVRLGRGPRPAGQPTNGEIAAIYGVTHSQISLILRRKEWRHI